MFEGWDSFYLLVGTGAGALVALVFVAVTLTIGLERHAVARGAKVYLGPTVFHFAVVLVLCAMALMPRVGAREVEVIVGAAALAGFSYAADVVVQLVRKRVPETPHWSDVWCYGVLPALAYVGLGVVALAAPEAPAAAPYGLAAAIVALLLVSVRNAWDLVTYIAVKHP